MEKGFSATRMDDIAQRAGVTKGTAYLYYENKDALFRAAVTQTLGPILDEGERVVAEGGKRPASCWGTPCGAGGSWCALAAGRASPS